ncbi:TonB-dependent receptor plug domain-containing protein [Microbulbifer yueqingensis]|uniref:Outer membrane receptor proteins, mostly Fe transport n=1 Tax=Microbulbifer yueqingensis TaxID=658219 RepID=A0A1G8VQV1_9GAMM|nr:TonB-dependent receptor [Microbulbifer yueqingensis]SDJ68416.1 Outer membrane receptor proteins, mostly Fe transport [Microbulbifer yueqingensis]
MERKFFKKTPLALGLSALLAALQGSPALAQQGQDAGERELELVEVTGSHIKRAQMDGPSPVASLNAEDIAATGVTDLIGLFTKLPISGQGTFSTQANSSDDTANGGSSVSLRGLGADSTLILVNGRRVSVSPFAKNIDTSFVDINNIPLAAIERVDVLKDGASATYGSDAIAGVINIILRDDFDGVELSGKVGGTSAGGGSESNLSMVWGNVTDNSSHTVIVDYFNREETLYADRDYARSANQAALRPDDPFATDFRSSAGIPGTIALASDPTVRLADTFGNDVCAPEDIDAANNLCRYDYAPFMSMVPSTERVSFNYLGRYTVTDRVEAFAEISGQNSKTTVKGAGSPSFNELFMSGDNPNHPFADMPTHPFYGQDLTMRRRTVDIGNRRKEVDSDYFRSVLGLEGELGSSWNWEAAYSYIKSDAVERGVDGFPNSRRVQEAIDSGLWDPFEPSSNSAEALAYIETTTTRVGKSTTRSVDAQFSGPLLSMPSGDLMLAIGAEHRQDSISDNPDDQFLRGDIFGTEATQANGSRDNTAVFAELAVPVLETLELQVAARHEDYSDFGTTTDPKVSFLWSPLDSVSFRGSWGTAFRAPSLSQLGLGRTDESPNLVDSIRCEAVGNINKACEPQEYTAVFAGNPDLGPEESESYNLGMIVNLDEQLLLTVDYYSYDIENIIDSDTQYVFSNLGSDPEVVVRLPSADPNDPGEVVTIYDSFQNIGDLSTSGIDLDLRYNLDTDYGSFGFSYVMNYMLEYEELRPAADGGTRINREAGDYELPELRWTTAMDWSRDNVSARVAVNFIDSFAQDAAVAQPGMGDIDSMTTVDTTVNYFGFESVTVTLGVTNLFDEEPPMDYADFMGFTPSVHSGQGRFAYLSSTYKF